MKTLALLSIIAFLGAGSCSPVTVPPPQHSENKVNQLGDERLQKIRDGVEGVKYANAAQPESPAKSAVDNEADRIADITGKAASEKGTKDALERVNLQLAGKLAEAEAKYATERKDVERLNAELLSAKAAQERDRQLAQAKYDEAVKKAKDAEVSFMIKCIAVVSSAFLLGGIGLGVFLFWSGSVSPKGLGAAGLLVAASIAGYSLIPFLSHPWIPYAVGGIILLISGITVILLAKSYHEKHVGEADGVDILSRVGAFTNDLRASGLPQETVGKVISLLDAVTDVAHQKLIKLEASKH